MVSRAHTGRPTGCLEGGLLPKRRGVPERETRNMVTGTKRNIVVAVFATVLTSIAYSRSCCPTRTGSPYGKRESSLSVTVREGTR